MPTETSIDPTEQSLPFELGAIVLTAPPKPLAQLPIHVQPLPTMVTVTSRRETSDLEKALRLFIVGGSLSVAIGTAAISTYGVSVDEAAAAAVGWLGVSYVVGRLAVHLTNSLTQTIPDEPQDYPAWMYWASGGILAGFVCEFLATTVALAAGVYSIVPLSWAVHPALVLCGVFVSVGFTLMLGSGLFALCCAGALRLLFLVVEYEALRLSLFLGMCGGSYRAAQLAPATSRHRHRLA